MKKWIAVMIIIFVMVVTLIVLAIFSLFDYVNENDIARVEDKLVFSPSSEGVEFLEDNVKLVKNNLIFKPELAESYIW